MERQEIKVFLVEDEIVVREGIKKNINWHQEGFEFVGEASDGELAYPLIQSTKPDILITDIKMPFMDGLELSRLVKKELPDIKILVLSGYNEFEYAKEAINIGITEYLVKPISGAKLLETVKKVAKTIEEERQQRQYLLAYQKEQVESGQLARQRMFGKLVSGKHPVSTLLSEGREIEMDLAATQYNILLFQVFTGEEAENYSDELNQLTARMEELVLDMHRVIMIDRGVEGFAFLIKGWEDDPIGEFLPDFLEKLEGVVKEYPQMEYFGGVGTVVERLSELNACFEKASHAYAYRYIWDRNQIVTGEPKEEIKMVDEELNLGALNVKNLERNAVERFLATGLMAEVSDFVEEYFHSLGEQNIQSMLFRQYITMDAYIMAASAVEKLGYDSSVMVEECGDFKSLADVFTTTDQTVSYLKHVLGTAIELRDAVSQKKYVQLLEDAKEYIRQNFQNEEISLNTVAASVNLSPNHFSTIFSQEMGQTFVEYLTFVRMERAKELLRNSNMKTSDIAFEVGYRDAHYFSYLFKKTQECTPREYRTR
ncbi:MAG: response regulator [Roseburia sp.]|nr:response regulator [Roseburia sp.]